MSNPLLDGAFQKRFWSKVDKAGPIPSRYPELGPCWLWTGRLEKDGGGRVRTPIGRMQASRAAFQMANGLIPPHVFACHRCDNYQCVNPDHMFAGSHRDNMQDMVAKGRHPSTLHPEVIGANFGGPREPRPGLPGWPGFVVFHGEDTPTAKLTEDDVREIRRVHAAGEAGYKKLAQRFGVSRAQVQRIIQRKA